VLLIQDQQRTQPPFSLPCLTMKDQYFGDINDYCKFSILLHLSRRGVLRTGVCWMLTPADGRRDGYSLRYLPSPDRFRPFAPDLFDFLHRCVLVDSDRRVARIEESGLLPRAIFHSTLLPDNRQARNAYFAAMRANLRATDWVFFDPDNGFEVSS